VCGKEAMPWRERRGTEILALLLHSHMSSHRITCAVLTAPFAEAPCSTVMTVDWQVLCHTTGFPRFLLFLAKAGTPFPKGQTPFFWGGTGIKKKLLLLARAKSYCRASH
jgi:hypothetical protein